MRTTTSILIALTLAAAVLPAQETKPVPKDSVRVFVPGCTKGYIFTAGPRVEGQPNSGDIPEGMHLRMHGPKTMMTDIKAHEGSMIMLTGLMKKGQRGQDGVNVGGGVRIGPGPAGGAGVGIGMGSGVNQILIDVEGWRPLPGECRSR